MNKKTWILPALALVLFTCNTLQAQRGKNSEQIKALKIAFFTERLSLSAEEASVFWPMYNAYEAEKEALRATQRREVFSKIEDGGYSEQQARNILNRYLEIEEQEEELDKRFNLQLSEEFSATRTLLLFQAEHAFRKRLLNEFRKRGGNEP